MAAILLGCRENNQDDTLSVIAARCSVRSYDQSRDVDGATVEALLKAAMSAPTAVNLQPWEFVVVKDKATLEALAKTNRFGGMIAHAPLAVVVCGDTIQEARGEPNKWWMLDCSAATENMLLAITAKGLGGVWTGAYPVKKRTADLQAALGLPKNIVPLNVVLLGYPKFTPTPKDKWDPSNIHWEKW